MNDRGFKLLLQNIYVSAIRENDICFFDSDLGFDIYTTLEELLGLTLPVTKISKHYKKWDLNELIIISKNLSLTELSEYFSVSKEKMRSILISKNLSWKDKQKQGFFGQEENKKLYRLLKSYNGTKTINELSIMLNKKPGTLRQFCYRKNIPFKKEFNNGENIHWWRCR